MLREMIVELRPFIIYKLWYTSKCLIRALVALCGGKSPILANFITQSQKAVSTQSARRGR